MGPLLIKPAGMMLSYTGADRSSVRAGLTVGDAFAKSSHPVGRVSPRRQDRRPPCRQRKQSPSRRAREKKEHQKRGMSR